MKTSPMKPNPVTVSGSSNFRKSCWLTVGWLMLAMLFSLGVNQQAGAQTYSLSTSWSAPNGTAHIANGNNNRGLTYDSISNQVFVATRNGASSAIDVFNGTTGTLLSGAGGIAGAASLAIDQIGESDDGVLYGAPLTTSLSTTTGSLTVYSWTNWLNNSTAYAAYKSTNGDPAVVSFPAKRIGDTMAVTGSGLNTLILMAVGGQGTNFVLLNTTNGIDFIPHVVFVPAGIPFTSGNILGITFYTNNTFLVIPGPNQSGANQNVFLVQFPANFTNQNSVTGTVLGSAGTYTAGRTTHIAYSSGGKMLAAIQAGNTTPNTNGIFNMANFPATAPLLVQTNYATPNANVNNTGMVAFGGAGKTNFLYVLESNNGMLAYAIGFTAAPVAPSISSAPVGISGAFPPYVLSVGASGTATLAYQWLASNSISSTFTNILGATTNTYAITTPSTNFYKVIITNSAGSVTSTPVRVALLTPVTSTVVTQLWSIAAGAAGYSYLDHNDNTRGIGYDTNSQRVVVSTSLGAVYIIDANNGTNIGILNMTGADTTEGTFPIDQVRVADDGAVYSGNLITSTSQRFKLNRWPAPTTTASAYVAYNDSGDLLKNSGDRFGDTMAVRGSGISTEILLGSRSGTNVAFFTTLDGSNFTATIIGVTGVPTSFAGLGITFGDGDSFWAKTTSGNLRKISFDRNTLATAVVLNYVQPSQIPASMAGIGVDSVHNILAGVVLGNKPNDLELSQLTGSSDSPVLFHQAFFPSFAPNGNGSTAVSMKYPRIYALDSNNGLIGLSYGVPLTTAPTINTPPANQTAYTNIPSVTFSVGASGSLPLYYQWQFSPTTNNAGFGNIPATNSSYILASPGLGAAGYYRVIVRNVAGFATSAPPALLTLLVPITSVVVTQLWTLPAGSLSFLDGSTYNTRGLAYDTNGGTLAVADHSNIHLLSATNGNYLGDLNVIGVFNGGLNGWLFDQVGVAADGTLYAANLTLSGSGFSIVTWATGFGVGSGASGYAYGGGTGADPGSGSGDRWGDTMDVRGSGTSTEIIIGSYNGTNVVLFTTTDGSTFTANLIAVTGVPLGFSGQGIAFGPGDTFYTKSPGYNGRQVAFNRAGWTGSVTNLYGTLPSDFGGIGVDVAANIMGGVNFADNPDDLQLFLLSGNANAPSLFDQAFFGSANVNSQENSVTTLKGGLGFALDVNNGITAVSYGIPVAPSVTVTSVAYAPGAVTLVWNNTFNGHGYQVQYKNNLLDVLWTNVGSPVVATGATATYTDTTASGATRFYRVVSQ